MKTKERVSRMFEHKEADRVPILDTPWTGTIKRWVREGMPTDMDWRDYFDVDKMERIEVDISPRYPLTVLEETERYIITKSEWGVTMKQFKEDDSTPEFIDYTVHSPEAWAKAKELMKVDRKRINWKLLEENYPLWKADDRWIEGIFWFGFDVTHSWMAGTETILIAMSEEPEWVMDMFDTYLDQSIAHFDMLWDAGYTFDSIFWYDDMGYKNKPFFSNTMYKNLLQPFHRRAVEWAHNKSIYAHLHSCGDISKLLPDVLDTGIDALNPLEIKAGMNPFKIKKEYGEHLVLHGGINAVLWDNEKAAIDEIERVVPVLKENGGYIFSSDHSIPNSVSLKNFKKIIATVKRVGAYK
ncbi:MAG TPA: hypothetical protein DIW17_13235 [Clostridiales bacterium]|nr:uroporphyrinogen decarboxylase family protein [Clostridia bacterium]HCS74824.1 hypothetical protein [Clostridiales bacterium]